MTPSLDLSAASLDDLRVEIERRRDEADRIPEGVLLCHIVRWRDVCAAARVGGLLKMTYSCDRIPGDRVELNEAVTRLNVIHLDAVMRTRDRRKPGDRKLIRVRFRQVVSIVATHADRLREIWKLTEEAYVHEAAELLRVGPRRIARTHRNGSGDISVGVPGMPDRPV